jgi:hypothetical protein
MIPQPAAEAGPALSEASRLSGVILEPKRAFSDIAARPRFWVPLLLSVIVALTYTHLAGNRVGWERVIRDAMEKSPRTRNIPAEQREAIIAQQAKITGIAAYPMAAIAPVAVVMIAAGLYLMIFKSFLGADVTFKQLAAVFSYAGIPNILSSLLAIVVMHMKPPEDFDIQNPLMFNLGAFLPEGTSSALVSLASSMDLFSFWVLALLMVGIRAAAPKLSTGAVAAGVLAPWILWLALKTAWASMFS